MDDPRYSDIQPQTSPEWRRFFRVHPFVKKWLPVFCIAILSSLIVLAAAGAVLWAYRGPIARALLASVEREAPIPLGPAAPAAPVAVEETAAQELSVTEVVAKANPSVVSIEVSRTAPSAIQEVFPGIFLPQPGSQQRVVGRGSGFFATSDGLIVTNRHVVDIDGATFAVITSSGRRHAASVVAIDPVLDVALLRVQGSGFSPAALGDSDDLALGQSVVTIGYTLGEFQNSISTGVISGLSRSIVAGNRGSAEYLDKVIQTDAAINPGNSGGPLLNLKGEVVGVNVAVAQGGENVGFALPINSVRPVIESVKRTGAIVRPYLGVEYAQVDDRVQAQLGLPYSYGIIVQRVIAGSPAQAAGIAGGDVILSIDGRRLDGQTSFAAVIRGKSVGQAVSLQVYAGGTTRTVSATLARAPGN